MRRPIMGLVFALASVVLVGTPASAEVRVGGLALVNQAGLSVGNPEISAALTNDRRLGAGAVVEVDVARSLALVSEPMLIGKGAKVSVNQSGTAVTGEVKLNYLELPLLAKYSLGRTGVRAYLLAGPTVGIKTGGTLSLRAGASTLSEEDISDQIRSTDLGLALGGGATVPIRGWWAFVEARYVWGLVNVNTGTDWNTEAKNRGIQLHAGFMLPIGARK